MEPLGAPLPAKGPVARARALSGTAVNQRGERGGRRRRCARRLLALVEAEARRARACGRRTRARAGLGGRQNGGQRLSGLPERHISEVGAFVEGGHTPCGPQI
jgi:hypothetical protein